MGGMTMKWGVMSTCSEIERFPSPSCYRIFVKSSLGKVPDGMPPALMCRVFRLLFREYPADRIAECDEFIHAKCFSAS